MPLQTTDYTRLVDLDIETRDQFPILKQSIVLWKHHLAFSGMGNKVDASVIYDYLTHPETGKLDDGLISQVKEKGHVRR